MKYEELKQLPYVTVEQVLELRGEALAEIARLDSLLSDAEDTISVLLEND
jgi:hypothetical protein